MQNKCFPRWLGKKLQFRCTIPGLARLRSFTVRWLLWPHSTFSFQGPVHCPLCLVPWPGWFSLHSHHFNRYLPGSLYPLDLLVGLPTSKTGTWCPRCFGCTGATTCPCLQAQLNPPHLSLWSFPCLHSICFKQSAFFPRAIFVPCSPSTLSPQYQK